jgi:hypothetical protein
MGRHAKINDLELIFLYGIGLTQDQMAHKLEVSRSAVAQRLRKLRDENPELLKEDTVTEFRAGESDELATLRKIILRSMKTRVMKDLKSISLSQLSTLYGILFDKDRLLRGEATEHVAHAHLHKQLDQEDIKAIEEAVQKMTTKAIEDSMK